MTIFSDEIVTQISQIKANLNIDVARYAVTVGDRMTDPEFIDALPRIPQILTMVSPPQGRYDNHLILKEAWTYSSTLLEEMYGKNNLVLMFETFGRMSMEEDEIQFLEDLEDPVEVYRGGESLESAAESMAWTLREDLARMHSQGRDPIVLSGSVNKMDVLAFYAYESEMIIRPGSITGIRDLQDM